MENDLEQRHRVSLVSPDFDPSQSEPPTASSSLDPPAPCQYRNMQAPAYSSSHQGNSRPVTPTSSTRCLVCLCGQPPDEFSKALRCAHPVCEPCLRAIWERKVMTDSEPFPRCPMPDCGAYASDAAASALLPARVAKRMRQLRVLKPARAADGRRLYCIADGCFEQLPPPAPKGTCGTQESETEREGEEMVSTCPDCGTAVCMRCGCRAHPGTSCVVPLLCSRQRRMYNAYAVGRVSACPRCGVHVERNGGCNTISCARCKWKFTFTPFRSTEEAEQATVVEGLVIREPPAPALWGQAFLQVVCNACFMACGTVLSETAVMLSGIFSEQRIHIISMPFLVSGIPWFLFATARFLLVCVRLLRHVGQPAELSVSMSICMLVLSVMMIALQSSVPELRTGIALGQWWFFSFFYFAFKLCGVSLLAIVTAHLVALLCRALWTIWQEW